MNQYSWIAKCCCMVPTELNDLAGVTTETPTVSTNDVVKPAIDINVGHVVCLKEDHDNTLYLVTQMQKNNEIIWLQKREDGSLIFAEATDLITSTHEAVKQSIYGADHNSTTSQIFEDNEIIEPWRCQLETGSKVGYLDVNKGVVNLVTILKRELLYIDFIQHIVSDRIESKHNDENLISQHIHINNPLIWQYIPEHYHCNKMQTTTTSNNNTITNSTIGEEDLTETESKNNSMFIIHDDYFTSSDLP